MRFCLRTFDSKRLMSKHINSILAYCYEYPPIGGGAGNALRYLCREWVNTGVNCSVVTSAFGSLTGEAHEEGVRVIRIPAGRVEVGRGRVGEMLRYIWASVASAKQIARRLKPDLSVAFMTIPSGAAPYYLKGQTGLPFVTELRGGDVPGFDPDALGLYHAVAQPLICSIWRQSSLLMANSKGLADLAQKTGWNISVQVAPNGVDSNFFYPDPTAAKGGALRCIYVGRMVESQKRVSLLIRLCGWIPSMRLALVGSGPDEGSYRKMARQLAPGRVEFHGRVDKDNLLKLLQSSDVYVSASGWEGMPNAALEAMACGLPLILSRVAGHEELVVDGVNGRLIDGCSAESWFGVLESFAARRAKLIKMGSESRRLALERHDWSVIAQDRLRRYANALQSRM